MVAFYKHDIPAWMDGTEALSDGAYRAYHVVCQLIYLNEGPIMLNERGIAGRCNQSIKTFRKHLDELLALGKLSMVDGRIANARAAVELESVQKNRENAGKGGKISGKVRKNSGHSEISPENAERESDKLLKNNDAGEAALKPNRSLKEKTREEKKQHSVELSETSDRTPALDDRTLEAALREAAGLENDPSPNLFVVGPVHALIGEGYDLERHILPVVRSLKAQGKRWSNWRYIVPAVREQNAVPSAPTNAEAPTIADPAKIRRGMLSMAKGCLLDGRWSDSWGPRRGEPGCRIPEEIWQEAENIIRAEKAAIEEALRGKPNAVVAHH